MKKCLLLLITFISAKSFAQFTNESELGIASANGNTKTQTFNFKQANDYKWDRHGLGLRSRYLNASANGTETARFFMFGMKYELEVSNRFGFFIGETLEKDKFANIDRRLITDAGGKYRFIDTESTKFFSELGYRYMDEQRLNDSFAYSNYGRFFTEWSNNWNKNFSTKYWVEYLPNFTELTDWQLNTELSLTAILNSVFSLKSGILLRYDHAPAPGIKYKTDSLFTTSLVAKF